MRRTTTIRMVSLWTLAVLPTPAHSGPISPKPDNPPELGSVHWRRGFDESLEHARKVGKPLLVLFQEVPGCSTCVGYGQNVLNHPLIVEAAESLFVPVAVYNNIEGPDRIALTSFNEPTWNNPVVRIVSADRKQLAPRLAKNYTRFGLVSNMNRALETAGQSVPTYLKLLAEESRVDPSEWSRATFAMHCFWEGEGVLGQIPGVIETRPGFVEGREVVDVRFDSEVLAYESLLKQAVELECSAHVYTHDDSQQRIASKRVGDNATRFEGRIKPDKEPKYYLSKTPYRHVPMTATQAARVNAAIGHKKDPTAYLSPGQIRILETIESNPDADWPVAIGRDTLKAWDAFREVADAETSVTRR